MDTDITICTRGPLKPLLMLTPMLTMDTTDIPTTMATTLTTDTITNLLLLRLIK